MNHGNTTTTTAGSVFLKIGHLVVAPGALDTLTVAGVDPMELVNRHQSGDWGNVSAESAQLNDLASESEDDQILSVYVLKNGGKVWVMTEADRSVTTVLLPSEY